MHIYSLENYLNLILENHRATYAVGEWTLRASFPSGKNFLAAMFIFTVLTEEHILPLFVYP